MFKGASALKMQPLKLMAECANVIPDPISRSLDLSSNPGLMLHLIACTCSK
jgi:hypothetical protein